MQTFESVKQGCPNLSHLIPHRTSLVASDRATDIDRAASAKPMEDAAAS